MNKLMFSNDDSASTLPAGVLVNLAKAGGSVIMLKDNKGMIYKEMNNTEELDYYRVLNDAKKDGKAPNSFLHYIVHKALVPRCNLEGHVIKLPEEESSLLPPCDGGYYKLVPDKGIEGETTAVLIMENLVAGMARPAMCDFKVGGGYVGQFLGEPGYSERKKMEEAGEVLNHDEMAVKLKAFHKYKKGKNTDGVDKKDVTNEHIGLSTKFNFKELKELFKSVKHELNGLESPVAQLKFRCCGMKVDPPEEGGKGNLFDYEPQKTDGSIKRSKPEGLSPQQVSELLQDFCQRDAKMALTFIQKLQHLSMWFGANTHYRYYASSVCFFYDQDDHSKCDVRWLDFAHAHQIVNEDGSGPKNKWEDPGAATNRDVETSLHNLIDCLSPVVWKYSEEGF